MYDTAQVKHSTGGTSLLGFKSYDQGRRSFQGTRKDLVWLDEEPPQDVYTECVLRVTDTEAGTEPGMIIGTFTPLEGMTEVVMSFLENDYAKEESTEARHVGQGLGQGPIHGHATGDL
jgi:phage terminase large subunit-like protein